ncbi:MAG: LamG domain-containing protein, partial [Planctomycetota bacterium]
MSYAESNPAINDELGTSAWFDPNVGMYRLDTGPNDILLLNGYQYTIEMWVKANEIPDVGDNEPGAILFAKSNRYEDDEQLTYAVELRLDRAVDYFHRGIGFDAEGNQRQNWRVSASRGAIKENEWYHIAAVWDITDPAGTQKLYIDGRLFANARIPGQNTDDSNAVAIGMEWSADSNSAYFFDGLIDELRVSTVALGPDEFLLVPGPEWARSPSPYNKETRVDPNGDLEWLPGISAASHDIYFGASLSDVNASATPEVSGHPTNTYDPGPLEYGTTYYWRIDEVNGIDVWEGVVWWFRTRSYVDDPNLLLWYEFEETEGHEAWDSSGHDYIGEVRGPEENWDPNDSHDGEGGCLLFDNDLAVIVEPAMLGNIYKEITVSVWLKDAYKDDDNWVFDTFGGGGAIELQAAIPDDDGEAFFRAGDDTEELTWDFDGADPETIEGWHHWAFIKNENDPNISMYFDGKLVDSNSSPKSNLNYIRNNIFRVGAGGTAVADLEAKMDDLRVYDYALSERDVQLIFRLGDLAVAWGPQPFNGKSEVLRGTVLYWKPGDWADLHDVYFGTDFNDVNDADTTLPVGTSVYKGTHALDANTYDPGELVLDTTYYWRIDEVNEANDSSPWKGRIWRFKTANYLIVEDFESYGLTSGAITDTWLDGIRYIPVPPFFKYVNGAAVSLGASYAKPADPVHGGTQCMVLDYLNDGDSLFGPNTHPFYSETERTFDEPQDFTEADVKILTLFFYGDPNNDANASERMYVALHDSTDANTVVKYGHYSDEDVNDVQDDEWHQWDVALAEFTSVQLNDVNKICIGFGDRENPVEGGLGIVHFDDIRLYIPKCVPWRLKPAADFTDDCKVDFDDLEDMAHQWLRADVNFVDLGTQPQDPGNSGLVAWWKLEKIDSNVPVDYTGHGYDGVL